MRLVLDGKSVAAFLRTLADELDVGAQIINFDTHEYASIGKQSLTVEWKVDKDGHVLRQNPEKE